MRHRLQWFIQLRAPGLTKGDEHLAYTPHGVQHISFMRTAQAPALWLLGEVTRFLGRIRAGRRGDVMHRWDEILRRDVDSSTPYFDLVGRHRPNATDIKRATTG